MAITGGIKFFNKNKITINSDIVASTGDASSLYIADENFFTNWRSSGSNDSTSETITITFSTATTIDRIHLIGHNWKNYGITYDSGTAFSSVTSLDSSGLSAISETTYNRDTSYYEFDSVSVTTIEITINTTQTAGQEKYLRGLKLTTEIGTLVGYPKIENMAIDKGFIVNPMISRRASIEKQFDVFAVNLNFEDYPTRSIYNNDIDIIMTLFDSNDPFYTWLCGGRFGTDYFKYTLRGFRLIDLKLTNISGDLKPSYYRNIYTSHANLSVNLNEVAIDG